MKRWILRISLGLLSLLVLATIIGAIYEASQRHQIRNEFPPLGKMVDVGGGGRIQLDCRGNGSPTVVFESGQDMDGSLGWYAVHDEIAKTTRACAYSRAGMVWSDPSSGLRTGKAIADDLHAALEGAGEHAPFVLVGHSFGGLRVAIYTKYYGSEVAGLVLVEPTPPDFPQRVKAITPVDILTLGREPMKWLGRAAWTGIPRTMNPVDKTDPKPMQTAAMFEPTSLNAFNEEWAAASDTLADAGTFRDFGARPLVVMTALKKLPPPEALASMGITLEQAKKMDSTWQALHNEEATWSSVSQHRIIPDSSHSVQIDKPEAVISAVQWVVDKVRGKE